MQDKKTILIAGAGFAGFNVARGLSKKLSQKQKEQYRILLVDKNDYHLFYTNLFEVATSEEEFTTIADLKKSIALPIKKYLPEDIEFLQGTISSIDKKTKKIVVDGKEIPYDYLVLSFGSKTDYFNIPGLQNYSMAMKSVDEALRIRSVAEAMVQKHRIDVNQPLIRFVVAGGGFSGVELTGEMVKFLEILAWKYEYSLDKLEIVLVEGNHHLLSGLPMKLGHMVYQRLKRLAVKVHIHTDSRITEVTKEHIVTANGEVMNYDLLIWTGGVRSIEVPFSEKEGLQFDSKSRVAVDSKLMVKGAENIFAAGDNALVLDKNKLPLPQTATQALYQSDYLIDALPKIIAGQPVTDYKTIPSSFIIPVCGKWAAIYLSNGFTMYGFLPWLARGFADLRYFAKVMPFWQAVKLVCFDTKIYTRND